MRLRQFIGLFLLLLFAGKVDSQRIVLSYTKPVVHIIGAELQPTISADDSSFLTEDDVDEFFTLPDTIDTPAIQTDFSFYPAVHKHTAPPGIKKFILHCSLKLDHC